jgi:hypothetical protein
MTQTREDVMAAALHAMYVDMCDGCAKAGSVPPSPKDWADLLANHIAELNSEGQPPPDDTGPQA